jgi:hypothetical protein
VRPVPCNYNVIQSVVALSQRYGSAFGAVHRVFRRTGSFERFSACAWNEPLRR